jgi:hypothetical protein
MNVDTPNRIIPMPRSGLDQLIPVIRYTGASVACPANMFGAICARVGQTNTSAQTLPAWIAAPRKAITKAQSPKVPASLDWRP